jgi:hypothetical protein
MAKARASIAERGEPVRRGTREASGARSGRRQDARPGLDVEHRRRDLAFPDRLLAPLDTC